MYFRNYTLWKNWLEYSLKSSVSEHALAVKMWKRPKYLPNLHESTFIMFFYILTKVDFEIVFLSDRWNVTRVC